MRFTEYKKTLLKITWMIRCVHMLYVVTRRTNVSTIVYALYFKISCVHKVRTKKKEKKNRRVPSIIYLIYFLEHIEMWSRLLWYIYEKITPYIINKLFDTLYSTCSIIVLFCTVIKLYIQLTRQYTTLMSKQTNAIIF